MMKNKTFLYLSCIALIGLSFSFQDRFFEIAKQIEIYNNVFKTLNINYIDEINPGDLTTKAINNTLADLDPYTRFYNEQQMEDVRIKREGEYAGIGISSWYTKQGIVVVDVKEGFAADKVGLKAGDIITKVDNQNLVGLETDVQSQVLKGSPNTEKSLVVTRGKETRRFTVTLDKIDVNPVPFFDMIDNETGYIKLTRFTNKKATDQVRKAIVALEEKGMKKLVFDLRDNPGGSLYDAVNITNLFIEKGKKVVDTRGKIKRNSRSYLTQNIALNITMPLVVLISDKSASASEIVSGALQDYDRAVIMGKRSFGKGLVQRYYKLNYGTQMKATISKYYTPSGRCIQELDYGNRDAKTGKVPKFSDGVVQAFKTEGGRTVYDGGGVMPDVVIATSKKTEETKQLLKSRAIFNFVTDYVRKHPVPDFNTYRFTTVGFSDFKTYLIEQDTSFVTKQEKMFKKAYQSVEKNTHIQSDYQQIAQKLKAHKVSKIDKNQDILSKKIEDEIIKRYFYEKGIYQYHLKNDKTVQQAVELLKNNKQYSNILGK